MPVADGGFEQAYNAQAAVAAGSMLVVSQDVVQAANDKNQIVPMLDRLAKLPDALGVPDTLLADVATSAPPTSRLVPPPVSNP